MSEQVKEKLPRIEYDSVGRLLLDLLDACPYIPESIKDKGQILYDATSEGNGVFILTDGGHIKGRPYVNGRFTGIINMQIAYQSFPKSNKATIAAQETLGKITGWLSDLEHLPTLADGRVITKFDVSGGYPSRSGTNQDASVVFVSNVTMEYEKQATFNF